LPTTDKVGRSLLIYRDLLIKFFALPENFKKHSLIKESLIKELVTE